MRRPFKIGDMVYCSDGDTPNMGRVVGFSGIQMCVEFPGWKGGHDGSGSVDGRGREIPALDHSNRWYVMPSYLTHASLEDRRKENRL